MMKMKQNAPIIYDWTHVTVEAVEAALDELMAEYLAVVAQLIEKRVHCTKQDFAVLAELSDRMHKVWSPVSHLKGVDETRVNKEVFARCEEKLSAFGTEIMQNERWYQVCKRFSESNKFKAISPEERMAIELQLRDFRLNGVHLPEKEKARCKEIDARLTALGTKFLDNIAASSTPENWSLLIMDPKELDGLPEGMKNAAHEKAKEKGKDGFLFFLGGATYMSVMKNAKNRELREKYYKAWNTRAADTGDHPEFDNAKIMEEMLALSHEKSQLLGFKNHAQAQLATRMAESEDEVMGFLNGILAKAKAPLADEMAELARYAREKDGIEKPEHWDISYYMERVKEEKYSVSQEEVRKYFPLPRVLEGMFAIVNRLYGISFKERADILLWHADAKYYDVYDVKGKVIAGIYMDFYERTEGKRSGAWMDEAVARRALPDGSIQVPVGYLTCNFGNPEGDSPSLLTMYEVETLLHEFGHDMQLLMTKGTVASVSGIQGVPWDGVELASQFMENFAWTREGVDLLSGHHITGEKLPDKLFAKMLRARNFGTGYHVARQISFALSDFRLYSEYVPGATDVKELFEQVHKDIFPMLSLPEYARMASSFGHIFGGGYSAGYYSYMWADVLAADAFSAFVTEYGTIEWKMGKKFLKELLSRGGSRPFMDSYVAFRGRKPNEDALMRKFGFIK